MGKQIKKIKLAYFGVFFAGVVGLALLSYFSQLDGFVATHSNEISFVFSTFSILYTLSCIYFTTKLLHFPAIRRYIAKNPSQNLFSAQIARFFFLLSAVFVNGALYWLNHIVSCFYLCLISAISYIFLYPYRSQCEELLSKHEEDKK